MKLTCPEISCQNQTLTKDGYYFRRSDSKYIQRYKCKLCGKRTSTARLSACFGQNKRTVNHMIEALICSKVSYRRIALILNIDKKTVARKVKFLGIQARAFNANFFKEKYKVKASSIEFDDLITKERTKMLPLTVSAAVDPNTRCILSLEVGKIPAFGHLARESRKKYGYRPNEMPRTLERMFDKIKNFVDENALIKSDMHQLYSNFVEEYFPSADYFQFKSNKGCVAGQGEMKKTIKDPIFYINHTFAMLRDNINRLVRRSWCVTQNIKMLQYHLEIYIKFHNTRLVK